MDPELPAEIIDVVFKELLVHEGLSPAQCEHVIAKLMQREGQLEYLFHEWSGVFPSLPGNARHALSKGLLPTVGRCPHAVLDFVLKELELLPMPAGHRFNTCQLSGLMPRCCPRGRGIGERFRVLKRGGFSAHPHVATSQGQRLEAGVLHRNALVVVGVLVLAMLLAYFSA